MPSTSRILERLPSVYRPEPGYDDDDSIFQLVSAVGALIDQLSADSAEVMQSHWSSYADSAIYSKWLGRQRFLNNVGTLTLDDPVIDQFSYLFDLPRIAGLVDVSPWKTPLRDRETVEAFRTRIRRVVQLHKEGLGTLHALRSVTMISLPQIDRNAAVGLRERNFTVEEFCGVNQEIFPVKQPGTHSDMVGPLMRWHIDNGSLYPSTPSIIIQGVEPKTDVIDPTLDPIIENFDPSTGTGIGIHYQGTLAAGVALAIVPGYNSWLGHASGIDLASAIPDTTEPVNPTADGPWSPDSGAPSGQIVDLVQTRDQYLWAAVNGADGALWRSDGVTWSQIVSGLPQIHCLLPVNDELLVGFETGLNRLPIQPDGDFTFDADPIANSDPAVNALAMDTDGLVWAATSQGLAHWTADALIYSELGGRSETETIVRCLWIDPSGDIYCGGEIGLLHYRRNKAQWYLLQGEAVDEGIDDWTKLDLLSGSLPDPNTISLPPVHAILHGPDTDIWLGTARGIARYKAYDQQNTYATLLEAFPQFTESRVSKIALDPRNRLWFATDEGLFVYDQLDWFQRQENALVRLPRDDRTNERATFWRFQRADNVWQSLSPPSPAGFEDFSGALIAIPQPAVHTVCWTTSAHPRLGSFDGTLFTTDTEGAPEPLAMRYKAAPDRIVEGGIVSIPRMDTGRTDWRYLQLEPELPLDPAPETPAWNREGRLLPPPNDAGSPHEGRFLGLLPAPDNAIYSFCPAARIWFLWQPKTPLSVTVRLAQATTEQQIDPQILDRVWNELQRVKPAAVSVYLAVIETTVRGL